MKKGITMRFIIFISAIGIAIIYFINTLVNLRKKKAYIKAGREWDKIVYELRKRK